MQITDDSIDVLYVDPGVDSADGIAAALAREDDRMAVRTTDDADEGLAILAEHEIDCLVSAHRLPEHNGIEFLSTVREEYPDLPVILYTDSAAETVVTDAIQAGATDCFRKDGSGDPHPLLAHRIRNAVDRVRVARQAEKERRINTVVRDISARLARASTRAEIDEHVCEIISDTDPYLFAWIGELDSETERIEPRSSAGIGEAYLDDIDITTEETDPGLGPTGKAVRSGELSVMQNIPEDPRYEPWREDALHHGYKSSAAVPLIHGDTLCGVLNVYADRTNAFDEHERQLLSDLGDTIAHAYHRVELQQQFTDQYQTLFEEAPIMVVRTRAEDDEPIIEDCNRAFADRLGYSIDELRETPLTEYYTDTSVTKLHGEGGYRRALGDDFIREQRTLVTRDGEEILTVLRASPRRNRDGDVIGTHAMFLDISEEQQIQELERQNERLEEFTSVVSHDLRNPLNVAEGRLELARDECDNEHLDDVADALERMATLIENLLTLAREGTSVETTEPVDLSEIGDACWRNVETYDATLAVESEQVIRADESRLEQLLENLIRNAVEHCGEDVTVTIGDLENGFYVADDGPGIPPEKREDVFESGYSTKEEGTGFGLSIVRGIVEAHGWEIRITESSDGGTRFEITGVETSAE